ncbi:hypothetical protein DFR68_107301 [Nocardia mexicana]|uniref:Uncharacterized protein n=1 Tax=Nocardia mexicana TaxID=279262 RepID=A0A370H0Z9_9NOCA|nr:hypothetical protein DFR68_107301 [Nocardia mexicana]
MDAFESAAPQAGLIEQSWLKKFQRIADYRISYLVIERSLLEDSGHETVHSQRVLLGGPRYEGLLHTEVYCVINQVIELGIRIDEKDSGDARRGKYSEQP